LSSFRVDPERASVFLVFYEFKSIQRKKPMSGITGNDEQGRRSERGECTCLPQAQFCIDYRTLMTTLTPGGRWFAV